MVLWPETNVFDKPTKSLRRWHKSSRSEKVDKK